VEAAEASSNNPRRARFLTPPKTCVRGNTVPSRSSLPSRSPWARAGRSNVRRGKITCASFPPGENTLFKFVNVDEVYKPSELIDMSGETTPPPADLVGWFEQHPYLQTDKPQQVTVGGIKGEQIDVVVGDLPEDYPEGLCGFDCVHLSVLSIGDWAIEEGNKDRLTVREDVKGQTVIIDFGSPAAKVDEFWPEAEKAVESVQWKGS
jgi:hypothetical protein